MSNNKKLIIYSLGVVGLIAAVFGLSYAYFESDVAGNEQASSIITLTENINIIYTDGPEVYIENLYPTKSITKDIMIENNGNTGALFKLEYINLINQVTNDEMVVNFTCEAYKNYGTGTQSEVDCFPMDSRVIPTHLTSSTETIEEALYIGPGITKIYHVKAQFLETGSNQSYNMEKRFSAKINVVDTPCDTNSQDLKCKILADNTEYADNRGTKYVKSNTGINFSEISSDTNGKGLYYTTDPTKTMSGERVYYYRGDVTNNNVIFDSYCWKIIRTNEDGSVKLIYNGVPSSNQCTATGTATRLTTSLFNDTKVTIGTKNYSIGGDAIHTGYMYATPVGKTYVNGIGPSAGWNLGVNTNHYITTTVPILDTETGYYTLTNASKISTSNPPTTSTYICYNDTEVISSTSVKCTALFKPSGTITNNGSGSYTVVQAIRYQAYYSTASDARKNEINSTMKNYLENWYTTYLTDSDDLIADPGYCNDRSIYSGDGFGRSAYFGAYGRLYANLVKTPTLECNQIDLFTKDDTFGNGASSKPIGLISADEVVYAGGMYGSESPNNTYYLYPKETLYRLWTLTPFYLYTTYSLAYQGLIYSPGFLTASNVSNNYGVRPLISLNTTAKVASGSGTTTSPYIIE